MITFAYQARDASGRIVSGIQDALNEDNAVTSLMSRGLMVLSLQEKSIASMKKAIELNPQNAPALNYLGYTWAEMGIQLDEAETLIQRALKIEPNDGFYIDSLGWVYYQKGDYVKAVEQLERAVEITVDDPTIIEHLGDAYEKAGKKDRATIRDMIFGTKNFNGALGTWSFTDTGDTSLTAMSGRQVKNGAFDDANAITLTAP